MHMGWGGQKISRQTGVHQRKDEGEAQKAKMERMTLQKSRKDMQKDAERIKKGGTWGKVGKPMRPRQVEKTNYVGNTVYYPPE